MTSWLTKVRSHAGRVDRVLRHADGLASVVAIAAGARGPAAYLGVALAGARFLAGALGGDGAAAPWVTPSIPPALVPAVVDALGLAPGVEGRNLVTVEGVRVLTYMSDGPHLQMERESPEAEAAMLRLLGDRVRAHRHVLVTGSAAAMQFSAAPTWDGPTPAVAESVWRRQSGFLEAGRSRCVMLVGPPGSGKTTVARALARRVVARWPDATSMRIAVANLATIGPTALDALLGSIRPDVLLVDDLERCGDEDGLLDLLEASHRRQRLVVVTCNDERRLSPAIRRPGRVDDVVVVAGAGPDLAAAVLGGRHAHLAPRVASWPVKYVEELADRLDHVDGADAEAEMAELAARVAEALGR